MNGKLTMRRPGESTAMFRSRMREIEQAAHRMRVEDRWDHKNEGTAQTHEHAKKQRQGPLARLYEDGFIDREQLQWACEIAAIAEMIQRDVDIRCASYETRVDNQGSAKNVLVENIWNVRRQIAYTIWRARIPDPKRAVLDMLVGDPKSYSAIAVEYRMGKRRARKLLISAIDIWPNALDEAESSVDEEDVAAVHARLA